MTNVWAIYKREMRAYFVSPLAYVLYVLFLVVCGVFFNINFSYYTQISHNYMTMMSMRQGMGAPPMPNYTDLVLMGITNVMTFILLFIIPMLSMRLFSEEKKLGTIELLMSYPIRNGEVLAGKFLAALTVFAGMLILTFGYALISANVVPDQTYLKTLIAPYVGVFLLGTAFLSFGIFSSSLTENQIVSGVISFTVLLVLWLISFVNEIQPGVLGNICKEISVYAHFEDFSKGVIDTGHVAYYILFSAFFLFLTLRMLESNK